ncbi:MAG: hypothetical protein LBT86_00610 [Deltaproteobacteria bacterium]|jgi:MFS family permease|nr:hypothetical protein [Deltaproteobacteria bacterium]
MPLPVISSFVTIQLGFSNALGGLAVGAAFLSTIATRSLAGRFSDQRGGKLRVYYDLFLYSLACLICFAAGRDDSP